LTPWPASPSHRRWLAGEAERLLEFARGARVEGGFGWLDADGVPDPTQPLQLLITTRMTHVFALGQLLGVPGCGPLADHGVAALRDTFEDGEHGGWFAEVGAAGPTRTTKEAYLHAFVLLAASSAVIAGRPEAGALLDRATSVMERFWSDEEGACVESWDREWRAAEDYRGANANMHAVEAFLTASDASGESLWSERALRIAERLVRDVAGGQDWRIVEHFNGEWTPLPDYNRDEPSHPFRPFGVTPGHGLEWARLLLHLNAARERPPDWLIPAARSLFARAVADGRQPDGGFIYTTDFEGRPVVTERLHWVLTEAIGAAAALHAVTAAAEYDDLYRAFWDHADVAFRDRERGSWRHELDDRLQPSERTWSGKPDVYHALQATLIPRLPLTASVAGALLRSAG
jgi:sulfoquinovose isomerase